MPGRYRHNEHGFTLIELVIVILVIGVLGTIAALRMSETIETSQYEQTRQEMDQLAYAIVGNPEVMVDGARTDFGFVGDNGTLPSTLDDLVRNPGGWSTWNGPYMDLGLRADDFKRDAWNDLYLLSDTLVRSIGSGGTIERVFAPSSSALLSNSVVGWIRDASGEPPGTVWADSARIMLTYPDGTGGWSTSAISPAASGQFSFSGIPVGVHTLRVVFMPEADTIALSLGVYPGRDVSLDIVFPADLW